jgi:hypothetical protein
VEMRHPHEDGVSGKSNRCNARTHAHRCLTLPK